MMRVVPAHPVGHLFRPENRASHWSRNTFNHRV
jgi:hypothetical protein